MKRAMKGTGRVYLPKYTDKRTGEVKISTVWWLQWSKNGTKHRESAETTKRSEARAKLNEKLADQRPVAPAAKKVTLDALSRAFVQDYELRGLRSGDTGRIHVRHLLDFFGGDTRARDITGALIQSYQVHRRQDGAEAATVNRETAALSRMFTLALKGGMLTWRPTFPDRLEENSPRDGFLEYGEYLAIRARLPEAYRDVLDFGYYSGWRLREITGLPWAEVDLPGEVIRLTPERSKTKKGRRLFLSPPLREVLARRLSARRLDTPLVFHYDDGKPIGDWRKVWKRACREAGLPGKLFQRSPAHLRPQPDPERRARSARHEGDRAQNALGVRPVQHHQRGG
jgi:integrase